METIDTSPISAVYVGLYYETTYSSVRFSPLLCSHHYLKRMNKLIIALALIALTLSTVSRAEPATIEFGADGVSVCGIPLKELCPDCCDGDDCNFSNVSFTECPDPKTFDCSTICTIDPPADE